MPTQTIHSNVRQALSNYHDATCYHDINNCSAITDDDGDTDWLIDEPTFMHGLTPSPPKQGQSTGPRCSPRRRHTAHPAVLASNNPFRASAPEEKADKANGLVTYENAVFTRRRAVNTSPKRRHSESAVQQAGKKTEGSPEKKAKHGGGEDFTDYSSLKVSQHGIYDNISIGAPWIELLML